MLFKDIFDIYQTISNKVVGILARARKNRLIHFEGETYNPLSSAKKYL